MRAIVLGVAAVLLVASAAAAPKPALIEPVKIDAYADEAMEPFLSRDGKFLFFNTRNDPGANTNIHFAEANGDGFVHRGVLLGVNSYALDAVPTMAADGRFCFISPRDYHRFLVTVYCGVFDGKRVNLTEPQKTLPALERGRLIFDVELSADGSSLIFAEGTFSGGQVPDDADLHLATWGTRGFIRSPAGAKIFANINTDDLEFAPAISSDGLELFFTRLTGIWPFSSPKIFRATRASVDDPFGRPERIHKLEGFVEGPSLAADGTIYFHKRVSGRYQIWRTRH